MLGWLELFTQVFVAKPGLDKATLYSAAPCLAKI
jgi:hypothetical protein